MRTTNKWIIINSLPTRLLPFFPSSRLSLVLRFMPIWWSIFKNKNSTEFSTFMNAYLVSAFPCSCKYEAKFPVYCLKILMIKSYPHYFVDLTGKKHLYLQWSSRKVFPLFVEKMPNLLWIEFLLIFLWNSKISLAKTFCFLDGSYALRLANSPSENFDMPAARNRISIRMDQF